jgi:hypothetical protein
VNDAVEHQYVGGITNLRAENIRDLEDFYGESSGENVGLGTVRKLDSPSALFSAV